MPRKRKPRFTYPPPAVRPLKVYAFDPTLGRRLNNYMTAEVDYEPLRPGPAGRYITVIDYDASNDRYYLPVDLNDPAVLTRGGLDANESDPLFHQQMVYAVVMETIQRFEFALGRPIRWRRDTRRKSTPNKDKLLVLPHAFQQDNAYYDSSLRALLFGYFAAQADDVGDNLPGQTVFTCLSHDIIAHETTHALVDGMREYFMESTNPDVPAFHEAFADIVALFQHFSYEEALLDTIQRTGGFIFRDVVASDTGIATATPVISAERSQPNPLVGLARQFGTAAGMRGALRSALGKPPDPAALAQTNEPHDRGAILVAAVFDAFFTIYIKRTRDLMRIARAGGASVEGEIHPDLARRLAREANRTAQHFLNICVRSLDYCPPVDIRFGEFLRAIITADSDLVPLDPWDYRGELIKAFRFRGIIPDDVSSYSEEALRWCGPRITGRPLPVCDGLVYEFHNRETDFDYRQRLLWNRGRLQDWAESNRRNLGLDARLPIGVHSFHPLHRVGPNGQLRISLVTEFVQQRPESLFPPEAKPTFQFRGGATVIFDHKGQARYVIEKSIKSKKRLERTREYMVESGSVDALRFTEPVRGSLFRKLHGGYL